MLLASGLYLIFAIGRSFHIGLGAMSMVGAYAYYAASYYFEWPWYFSLFFGMGVSALAGVASYLLLQKFVFRSQRFLLLATSTAFGVCLESLLGIIFGSEGRFLIDGILSTYDFFGLRITQVGLLTLIFGFVLALLSYIFLYLLPYGRVIRSLAQHRECASLVGVKEKWVSLFLFIFTAVLAGIVGILTGMNNAVTPISGLYPIAMAFMALLVGGLSDFKGVVVGSYVLVLIPEVIVASSYSGVSFSGSWKLVFVFLLSLFILLLRPNGIFSSVIRKN